MKDKTRDQLIAENEELRRRVAAAESIETELRRSEVKWRSVAENATDIIYRYRFRPTPCFEYISPSAAAITGYTIEEFYADPELVYRIAHPDDQEKEAAIRREIMESPASHLGPFITQFVRKDGTTFWAERHVSLVRDESGNVVAVEGVSRDITARKRAEEALRQSEQRLSLHFQQTPLAAIEWDVEGRVTKWNPGAVASFRIHRRGGTRSSRIFHRPAPCS